ncbi:MAG: SDR family NAD(P)-dependent oxidoreductase [Gammaproteobacteria bacterium]|nr:SDR family NAD(P)-dependent oxidoreductase [Gammaproteobacteria bacterium]
MNWQQLKKIVAFYTRFTLSFTQVGYRVRRLTWPAFKADFAGQHWLVTGGLDGLGLFIAREAARHGAHVTIAARNEQRLAQAEMESVWFDHKLRPAHVHERTRVSKDTPESLVAYLDAELAKFPDSAP